MRLLIGKYIPCESFLHSLDPRSKILGTFIIITSILLINNLWGYIIPFFIFIILVHLSKINFLVYLSSVKSMWFLILFASVIQFFVSGLEMSLFIALRLFFVVVFASFLTFTTPPLLIARGLSSIMKWFGIKESYREDFSMIMTISMRFIPILFDEIDRIIKAQIARGAKFDQPGLRYKIKGLVIIIIPLLISAIRKAEEISIALQARKYGIGPRTSYYVLEWTKKDSLFLSLTLFSLFTIIIWG
ncbi:energy-coupling factor transporter transmembrane component T family protein [Thermosipho atlanticus]|uniref:Energy-coupling factor transport system permease protein n=1 Tax=Thermosipho atlanticus DSM 15807 TaxID=1123380 RepID=A0A1M5SMY0_9BACT|nr:energy-coupling factor transporter transmembrane protein EcfT [Thermosipho atlanticus]SHH39628.1 energy-coupling factor transport system permease protein [Thermosipho atlanticus DSM 15807]